jgi:prevent-host-death family protein
MITETSAVAFRQNLGEMLNIVQYRNDSVLIKKDGKPVAALIDARVFERIRRIQERFDALCDRLEQTYTGMSEEEALAEIERASLIARAETADAWRAAGRLPALPERRSKTRASPATPGKKAARRTKVSAKSKTSR